MYVILQRSREVIIYDKVNALQVWRRRLFKQSDGEITGRYLNYVKQWSSVANSSYGPIYVCKKAGILSGKNTAVSWTKRLVKFRFS